MNSSNFKKVLDQTLDHARNTLGVKAEEYVRGDNRLHNFDRAAQLTGQSREKALWGFALKHLISIMDIRDDIEKGKLPSMEMVNEKYGDLINYLILEKASIVDRINQQEIWSVDEQRVGFKSHIEEPTYTYQTFGENQSINTNV